MEDFDSSVAPAESGSNSGKMGLIGLAVGVVGIIVGLTGIVMANSAQKEVAALNVKLSAQPDKTPELERKLADIDERLVKLGGEFVKLQRADRDIQTSTQTAFNEVGGTIKANRDAINELGGKVTELVTRLENWTPSSRTSTATAATAASGGSGGPSTATEGPADGIYLIQSGDTLSSVAKRFNISLSALMAANPTVNPRNLQIGQRIVIP